MSWYQCRLVSSRPHVQPPPPPLPACRCRHCMPCPNYRYIPSRQDARFAVASERQAACHARSTYLLRRSPFRSNAGGTAGCSKALYFCCRCPYTSSHRATMLFTSVCFRSAGCCSTFTLSSMPPSTMPAKRWHLGPLAAASPSSRPMRRMKPPLRSASSSTMGCLSCGFSCTSFSNNTGSSWVMHTTLSTPFFASVSAICTYPGMCCSVHTGPPGNPTRIIFLPWNSSAKDSFFSPFHKQRSCRSVRSRRLPSPMWQAVGLRSEFRWPGGTLPVARIDGTAVA
mmetsp:Transcript_28814/g.73480  ORF Transcript_28814/g.73480 Transcript_28814/m.73480 type:complete len:283 (+) Transcript_28814:196-1044(+)